MIHPPRPGDLPRTDILALAQQTLDVHAALNQPIHIHFKFTCPACGERCVMSQPNILYADGECFACGHTAPVTVAGFLVVMIGDAAPAPPLFSKN